MIRQVGVFIAGVVLTLALLLGWARLEDTTQKATAGATAYGWLGSPAAPGAPDNRAAVLERLIARELETKK